MLRLRRFLVAASGVCLVATLLGPGVPAGAATTAAAPGIVHRSTTSGSATDASALTLGRPGDAAEGDVLVARIVNRGAVTASLTAAGWTPVGDTHSAAMLKAWVLTKVVTGSEPSSYTFSQSATTPMAGTISAYSGVDPSRPVDVFAGKVTGNSTTFTAPAVTSTSGNDVAVWFGSQLWTGSSCPSSAISPPSGFAEVVDQCLDSSTAGLVFDSASRQLGAAAAQPVTVMAPATTTSWNGSSAFGTTNLTQVVLLRAAGAVEVASRYSAATVKVGSFTLPDDELHEPSGLAASRVNPGTLYVHSEDDDKTMAAISTKDASVQERFTLSNTGQWDWEDIATGPCPAGSCIYVGDIGGSKAGQTRTNDYNIFRVAEPTVTSGTAYLTTERFRFDYPDGAHNAEALLVHPDTGQIYVVTKEQSGRSGVYTFPAGLPAPSDSTVTTLTKVTTLQLPTYTPADSSAGELFKAKWYSQVTAGSIHPAANRFLLRTPYAVWEYRGTEGGSFDSALNATPVALTAPLGEGQGEAIEYAPDGSAYYTLSERVAPPFTLHRIDRM